MFESKGVRALVTCSRCCLGTQRKLFAHCQLVDSCTISDAQLQVSLSTRSWVGTRHNHGSSQAHSLNGPACTLMSSISSVGCAMALSVLLIVCGQLLSSHGSACLQGRCWVAHNTTRLARDSAWTFRSMAAPQASCDASNLLGLAGLRPQGG